LYSPVYPLCSLWALAIIQRSSSKKNMPFPALSGAIIAFGDYGQPVFKPVFKSPQRLSQ
jgi:hypothetical protein